MQLHITKLIRKDTKKDGTLYVWPSGDKYRMLWCQTQEYGTKWLSCAESKWNEPWKVGDTVEADVEQKGDFLNLKRPDPMAAFAKSLNELLKRVEVLEQAIFKRGEVESNEITDEVNKELALNREIPEEELPF